MNILMLGVKEYPYGVSSNFENFPGGGTAKYVITLSKKLIELGHTVTLIVRRMPGQNKFESTNGLKIYRVPWINDKYLRLPTFSFFSFIKALFIVGKVDVIHSHGSFDALTGVVLGKIFHKKTVGTPHGLTSFQAKNKFSKISVLLTRCIEKLGFSSFNMMIYLSEVEKNQIEEILKIKPAPNVIINMGIEPVVVEKRSSDKFYIVFIGRIVPIKGLDKLVLSMIHLPVEILKDTKVIIVGDGFYKNDLVELVKEKNLHDFIIFEGFQTAIKEYLAIASLFILPSEGGEGLPVSLLEAMSAGVPCLVSNFILPMNCKSVIYLENNNPMTIASVIKDLYNDRLKLEALSKEVKADFQKFFALDKVSKNFEKVYKEVIGCAN